MEADSESFDELPSAWSVAVTVAVFTMVGVPVPESTVALIVSVAEPEAATVPTLQTPVPDTYEPWVVVRGQTKIWTNRSSANDRCGWRHAGTGLLPLVG